MSLSYSLSFVIKDQSIIEFFPPLSDQVLMSLSYMSLFPSLSSIVFLKLTIILLLVMVLLFIYFRVSIFHDFTSPML